MIIYRPFTKTDINQIDTIFKQSMLSTLYNVSGIYLFVLDYYKYFILFLYLLLPIHYTMAIIILLPTLFYIGSSLFLFIYVHSNLPSYKLDYYLKKDNNILLIVEDEKIVGFCSFIKYKSSKHFGFMEYFFIHIEHHNRGYGKKLLNYNNNYIKMNYVDDYNQGKYIIGGTSSLQLDFWKKYATKIEETDYIFFGYTVPKWLFAVRNYQIYFNKYSKINID